MRSLRTAAIVPIVVVALACSGGSNAPTAIELPIDSLAFASNCTAMVPGDTCSLSVEAYTEDGQRIGNPVLRWTSFNSSIASVSDNGLVTAKAPGTATIEVSNTTSTVSIRTDVRVLPLNPK